MTEKEEMTNALCVDQTYHDYHFPAERLAFSVDKTRLTLCVLINFSSLLFPAERLSFSEEAKTVIEKVTGMTVSEKGVMTNALCVSIECIMVIISWLRGSLACTRQKSLRAFW